MTTAAKKEYARLRTLGWSAKEAKRCAQIRAEFESRDDLRCKIVPDNDADWDNLVGDMFTRAGNPDTPDDVLKKKEAAYRKHVDQVGVWGFIIEKKCGKCGHWEQVDSCWGFVGENDPYDSGYAYDGMAIGLAKED